MLQNKEMLLKVQDILSGQLDDCGDCNDCEYEPNCDYLTAYVLLNEFMVANNIEGYKEGDIVEIVEDDIET